MMAKNTPQIRELRTLKIGQSFKVYALENYFRNLILTALNDSCATVKGEYLEDGKWKYLSSSHTFSCRTEIVID